MKIKFDKFSFEMTDKDAQNILNTFKYFNSWINDPASRPISLTLPLSNQEYFSNVLFPFFDGLIPEGWLLEIAVQKWKLNRKDRMGLLLTVCEDTIGAVSVKGVI